MKYCRLDESEIIDQYVEDIKTRIPPDLYSKEINNLDVEIIYDFREWCQDNEIDFDRDLQKIYKQHLSKLLVSLELWGHDKFLVANVGDFKIIIY